MANAMGRAYNKQCRTQAGHMCAARGATGRRGGTARPFVSTPWGRAASLAPSLRYLPFYQFTQPSVAVSPFSGNLVDFFDSFSVRFLRGQGPQNATHGDRDSLPTGPPTARAGDPTGPSPAVRRPPRSLSTATRRARPH